MDQRLAEAARSLSELATLFPPEHLGDLVDLTIGALASLIRAEQLKYQDRIGTELPHEYYSRLGERVKRMETGTLPQHGRWLSGYYFNSALLRLGAAREISQRLALRYFGGSPDRVMIDNTHVVVLRPVCPCVTTVPQTRARMSKDYRFISHSSVGAK
jgi:hypothetical protein